MTKPITFDAFKSLLWQDKLAMLQGFDVKGEEENDKFLYDLAMANIIMFENHDVLKRLANS